jgi:hypothetical protein
MFRYSLVLGSFLMVVTIVGCADVKKPVPVPVKGTVKLDGKPLADGEVAFCLFGEPPRVILVKDGQFSGEVLSGSNRVEVHAFKAGPPLSTDPTKAPTKVNFIPDRYSSINSKLTADVAVGGSNDFSFAVTSR